MSTSWPGLGWKRRSRVSEMFSYRKPASRAPTITMMRIRTARLSHDWEMAGGIGVSGMHFFWARGTRARAPAPHFGILHDRRHGDAHDCECANEFAADHRYRGQ